MQKRLKQIWLTSLALLLAAAFGPAHASEAPLESKDGIVVWKVPSKRIDLIGFKAQTVIDAPMKTVLATIMDTDNANEWIPSTGRIDVIDRSRLSQGYAKLYYLIDMPFPLADRDLVLTSRIEKDAKGNIRVANKLATDPAYPPSENLVRIKTYEGSWYLEPLGAKQTRVTLDGMADPGGAIPAWATNLFVTKQPTDMLKNMREQVKKKRYAKPELPFEFIDR